MYLFSKANAIFKFSTPFTGLVSRSECNKQIKVFVVPISRFFGSIELLEPLVDSNCRFWTDMVT